MNRGILSYTFAFLISLTWVATVSSFSTPPAFRNVASITTRTQKIDIIHLSESAEDRSEVSVPDDSSTPPEPVVKCPDCDKCDGSGRILGGIPLILPWWPIKPYRPCPNFIANGGQYSRIGQPLDEIAFGRGSTGIDTEDDDF
jgi:hypothetical protein